MAKKWEIWLNTRLDIWSDIDWGLYKEWLESDSNLHRWYNNIRHSSIPTAEGALRRLGKVWLACNSTPNKLAKMNLKNATSFLMDLVTLLDEEGKQPSTIKHSVEIVKSWFRYSGIRIIEKVKLPKKARKPSKVQ